MIEYFCTFLWLSEVIIFFYSALLLPKTNMGDKKNKKVEETVSFSSDQVQNDTVIIDITC